MVASENFTDAFMRARKEKPGFTEGGQLSQGLPPSASLGYQAGNIVNQASSAVAGLKDIVPQSTGPRFNVNASSVSKIDPNLSGGAFTPENSPSSAGGASEPILGQEAMDRRRRSSPEHLRVMGIKQGLKDVAQPAGQLAPQVGAVQDATGNSLADFVNTANDPVTANRTPVGEREAVGALMGPNYERKVGGSGVDIAPVPIPAARATATNPHGAVTNISPTTTTPPIQRPKPPDGSMLAQHTPEHQPFVSPKQNPGAVQPVVAPASQPQQTAMPGAAVPLSMANPANDPSLYNTNRTTGPIMLTNIGPGNAGGKALGDVAAFKTANALEGSRPPSGPATEIPAGSLRQVGNLDVQFAPGTDRSAINRFMENPVRPTAQINRYDAQVQQSGLSQGQLASMNADRILGKKTKGSSPTDGLLTKENAPGMGWKQRSSLNERIIANQGSLEERTIAEGGANTRNQGQLGVEREKLGLQSVVEANRAKEMNRKNTIDENLSTAQIGNYKASSSLNEGRLAQVDTINKLQQEYLSPDTDSKRKSAIATELRTLANKDEKKDKGDVPTYVKPEFDKKGVQRPGTGRFVYPPGYIDSLFGNDFNSDNASPEQMSVLLDLAKNDPEQYKALKNKFN